MRKIYLTVGMVLLLTTVYAVAEKGEPAAVERGQMQENRDGDGTWNILRYKEKLGLSEDQVTQFKAAKDEIKDEFKASAEAMNAARKALDEAVTSGAPEADIRAAANVIGKAIGDQAVLKARINAKAVAILTAEQLAKMKELKNQKPEVGQEQAVTPEQKKDNDKKGEPGSAFARIDTDGDGVISLEEFNTHMAQMKERSGARGGERSPKPERPAKK